LERTVRIDQELHKTSVAHYLLRQIRNAFQAAIALVEYDSQQTKEGDPKPALGEPQFSIVAESSREFDSYLISTLGAAESDIARREEWRFDRFGNMETKQPPMPRSHDRQKAGFYGKAHNIDDDTSSDDDDDDGDDDDDSNKSDTSDNGFTKRQSRKKARAAVTNEVHDETEQDFKEFQEFMKQKRARKNGK
jgi:hypothetical protein